MPSVDKTINERANVHGDYDETARISQTLKIVLRESHGWENLTFAQQDSLEIIALKMARILSGNPEFADHWHDIQGYAKLIEDRLG